MKYILAGVLLVSSLPSFAVSCNTAHRVYERILQANGLRGQPLVCDRSEGPGANYGDVIVVNPGLLGNIDVAAVVIGHELAHNRTLNESGADVIGAKYTSRAGYNVCRGARPLLKSPGGGVHPPGIQRYKRLGCRYVG